MSKVILTAIVLTTLILFSGVYGQGRSVDLNGFVEISKEYFENIDNDVTFLPLQKKYNDYCKLIVQNIHDDSYRASFDALVVFTENQDYEDRVLFKDVMKSLKERINLSLLEEHYGDYTLERFLTKRFDNIEIWWEENIVGNTYYFLRTQIIQELNGKELKYSNIVGDQLFFTVTSENIQSVEECSLHGETCLKVIIGEKHLRWTQFYDTSSLQLVKSIQNFNS